MPRGGPDGGDGGRGGDVVLVCDDSLRDLETYRRKPRTTRPSAGGHGSGSLRHGADGDPLELRVPPGTEVLLESDGTRHDLVVPGQRAVVARGGSGGRGNKRFAGPTHQTPRFAERGLAGDETWLTLQLKLLADVGLIGLPNAGKSSLLSRLTRAQPKVAGYPFTTLSPVLGTLQADGRQLVIADIPGLIEGASDGAGLGHEFLAHVERTRLLVHVLESGAAGRIRPRRQPRDGRGRARSPTTRGSPGCRGFWRCRRPTSSTPRPPRPPASDWQSRLGDDVPVIVTSSVVAGRAAGAGGQMLRRVAGDAGGRCDGVAAPIMRPASELAEHRVFRPAAPRRYTVRRLGDGSFAVDGAGIERLLARYDLDNEEALAHLERRLRGIGVIDALAAQGFEAGDDVRIAGVEFDLDPEH